MSTQQTLTADLKKIGFRIKQIRANNPELKRTRIPFVFPQAEHPGWKRLRESFDFDRVVKNKDEFRDQLALAKWINRHVYRGSDNVPTMRSHDPIEILKLSREKKAGFWCGHFSIVFPACANAMGFVARGLAIDSLHTRFQDSTHHGVAEIYSTSFRKWYAMDAMHNCYYTKDNIPLNAYEIAQEWLASKGKNVRIRDCDGNAINKSHKFVVNNRHESSAYYFFYTPCELDPFSNSGDAYPIRMVFFQDKRRQKQVWYQGAGGKSHGKDSRRHIGYNGMFMYTDRLDDFYYDVNTIQLKTRPITGKKMVAVTLETLTPNLSHFLYRFNSGRWQKFSGQRPWNPEEAFYFTKAGKSNVCQDGLPHRNELVWPIRRGFNSIEAKPCNLFGREGATSSLQFTAH